MLVILLNCVTLGMYQPCDDMDCLSERCKILQVSPAPALLLIFLLPPPLHPSPHLGALAIAQPPPFPIWVPTSLLLVPDPRLLTPSPHCCKAQWLMLLCLKPDLAPQCSWNKHQAP
jgi:hypothetical protein